ncbi:TPA: superoxide dismutase [Candidatus Nomurabacteria bacterium]|uniref:superoxide dismutase n=2 Tax=Candidatus Nomuraibacteriota TaxID=1752729 RepID=A0A1F6YPV9_9BACT|nr:MAG: Manganese and iron superoxide dismutase [Parcubacteria group bacterium GW2011_GWC1_42_21]KKS58140.1 MAG: Manganese and iron superoxide dismutase [Candidatus Nomurabacteria bacterium GW2011_GWF1_42_40]KKT00501.1 MAG: Manganese and iron superoxide dismutase [Candidatus Nomurabacteria bacterium GW2011_GWA1_43_17]KKT07846.1 MAG: Manganese and iron superoxide dismutase [Candidatus Nomurabacteria bacterium GW2011_GWB1_43_19]KKT11415.1 MAG: Manganese and iron superoxide dismutase [Candidatus N
MKKFEELKFNIGELKGISVKNIEEHLKLYAGYVKNTNLILEKIPEYESYAKEDTFAPYVVSEIQRRFSFEFNGMRNHEYYFKSLESGAKSLSANSQLKTAIEKFAPSFDAWLAGFKTLAMTRGIGWAVLGYDKKTEQLVHIWIDEQHLGQLNGVEWVLGIDMWEHAFIYDYPTSEKKKYVEAFFANLNWEVIEKNFKAAQ